MLDVRRDVVGLHRVEELACSGWGDYRDLWCRGALLLLLCLRTRLIPT